MPLSKCQNLFTSSLSKYTNNLLLYLHRKAFKVPTIIMFNQFVAHSFLIFCVPFARRCSLFAKNIDHTFNKQCEICTKTIRAERKTQIIIWKLIMSSFLFSNQLNRRTTVYHFYLYRLNTAKTQFLTIINLSPSWVTLTKNWWKNTPWQFISFNPILFRCVCMDKF